MSVPSATIGKVAGGIVGVGLVAMLVLWARSTYTIEGRIEVDMVTHRTPVRDIEVWLIERAAEDDMTNFVAEYESFMHEWPQTSASQLFVKALEHIAHANTGTASAATLDTGALKASGASSSRSDAEVRAEGFRAYAKACREMKEACPIGGAFYDHGARFWENQAARLAKEGGGVIYTTRWVSAGGLGGEPVQVVSVVAPQGGTARTGAHDAKTPSKAAKAPPREGGIVPGSTLTTNEVRAAAAEYEQALDQEYARLFRDANNRLVSLTNAQTKTDEDGRYVFSGDAVQPGHYLVFAKYDTFSTENEQISFMWFQPVDVTPRRLAFSRKTVVDLNSDNQRKPQVLDMKVPTTNDLFTVLADRLRQYNHDHPPSP